jgi:hypothetical protein
MATLQEIRERCSIPQPPEEPVKEQRSEPPPIPPLQQRLIPGKTYRVTGSARGNGSGAVPRVDIGGRTVWVGNDSEDLQTFDVTYVHEGDREWIRVPTPRPPQHPHCSTTVTPVEPEPISRAFPHRLSQAMKAIGVTFKEAAAGMMRFGKTMEAVQATAAKAEARIQEQAIRKQLAEASGASPQEVDDLVDAMRYAHEAVFTRKLEEECPQEKREKPTYPKQKQSSGRPQAGFSTSSMKSSRSRWTRPQAMRSRSSRGTGPKMTMR